MSLLLTKLHRVMKNSVQHKLQIRCTTRFMMPFQNPSSTMTVEAAEGAGKFTACM